MIFVTQLDFHGLPPHPKVLPEQNLHHIVRCRFRSRVGVPRGPGSRCIERGVVLWVGVGVKRGNPKEDFKISG